mmetsp:Transcript_472/g.1525  ORF Transcript_472/g.1525 Transcript_472/m.1525 type:complete len:205 (-) Transcript_472:432-1046(-)
MATPIEMPLRTNERSTGSSAPSTSTEAKSRWRMPSDSRTSPTGSQGTSSTACPSGGEVSLTGRSLSAVPPWLEKRMMDEVSHAAMLMFMELRRFLRSWEDPGDASISAPRHPSQPSRMRVVDSMKPLNPPISRNCPPRSGSRVSKSEKKERMTAASSPRLWPHGSAEGLPLSFRSCHKRQPRGKAMVSGRRAGTHPSRYLRTRL